MKKHIVIIAPHEDDEIIGCFEILEKAAKKGINVQVLYPNSIIRPTWAWTGATHKLPLLFDVLVEDSCDLFLSPGAVMGKNTQFLFPDPVYETHPEHRRFGHIGEGMLRRGADVLFYSVNMQAPYIRETKEPEKKRQALEMYYPDKQELWKYDHKYFLFEGQVRWIVGWK